jgi:hypothetical protein
MRIPFWRGRAASRAASRPIPSQVRLDAHALEAVRALGDGVGAGLMALADAPRPALEALWEAEEALAGSFLRYCLGAEGAPAGRALRREAHRHRERVAELGDDLAVFTAGPASPGHQAEAALAVGPVRLAALEGFGRDAFVHAGGGELALATREVTPAEAHGLLVPRVLTRATWWAWERDAAGLETRAAGWWFSLWSPPPGTAAGELFAETRAHEWAVADHSSAVLRAPVLTRMLESGGHRRWGALQRRTAELLAGGEAGVWEVRAAEGRAGVLVAPGGAAREVEALPRGAEPGMLLFGRVAPLEGGRWFASPAMEAALPSRQLSFEAAARLFEEHRRTLPPAVAAEAAFARLVGRAFVPRRIPPAPDARAAGALLLDLRGALAEELGIDPSCPRPAELDAIAGTAEALAAADSVLMGWFNALREMVEAELRIPRGRRKPEAARRGKRR